MRYFLVLMALIIVVGIGCVREGDKNYYYNYYYPDTTSHQGTDTLRTLTILSPTATTPLFFQYQWVRYPYPGSSRCDWVFKLDTVLSALVTTNIPGGVHDAQAYVKSNNYGGFVPYGQSINPVIDTFSVGFYRLQSGYSSSMYADTIHGSLWIQAQDMNDINYVSRTVPFNLAPRLPEWPASVPDAPIADTLLESDYQAQLYFYWCLHSPNVQTLYIYHQAEGATTTSADTLSLHYDNYTTPQYYPRTRYAFWIKAANSYGTSAASDTLRILSANPHMPTDLSTSIYSGGVVRLNWYNHLYYADSLFVARRDSVNPWHTIQRWDVRGTNYLPSYCYDSTATAHMAWYYRIGISFPSGTWWTADSVGVWLP